MFSGVPLPVVTLEPNGSRGKHGNSIRLSVGRTCTQPSRELPGVMISAQGTGPAGKHPRERPQYTNFDHIDDKQKISGCYKSCLAALSVSRFWPE
jgi:hypothetical protein